MDALAAVSVFMSIATKTDVPNLKVICDWKRGAFSSSLAYWVKELAGFKKEDFVAIPLKSTNVSWRIQVENQSLLLIQDYTVVDEEFNFNYESLLAHQKLCPELAPVPYCHDKQWHASVLQDFPDYDVLSDEITASRVDLSAIKLLGSRLGQVHKASYFSSNSIVVRDLQKKFRTNSRLKQLFDDLFVVTFGQNYVSNLANGEIKAEMNKIIAKSSLMEKVASLKGLILSKHECLSHCYLSTSSIGVKHGDVKLLNGFDGTFLGPSSYDIAALLADYITFYYKHMLTEIDNDSHRQVGYKMIDASAQMVDAYFEAMKLTVNDKVVELVQESNVMPDIAGICGVMLIARGVRESCADREAASKALEMLHSGVRLLDASHRIDSLTLLLNIGLMLLY